MAPTTTDGPTPKDLGETVRARDVCYEVAPEYAMIKERRVSIGCVIEMSAETDCGGHDDLPGCDLCDRVYLELRRIADWVIEKAGAENADIEAFDSAWHSTSGATSPRRIILRIRLTRYGGAAETLDAGEQLRLASIESSLAELGVRRGSARSRV